MSVGSGIATGFGFLAAAAVLIGAIVFGTQAGNEAGRIQNERIQVCLDAGGTWVDHGDGKKLCIVNGEVR